MDTFPDVIAALTEDTIAAGLGVNKTLVAVWKHRKRIPYRYWYAIAALEPAKKKRVTIAKLVEIDAAMKAKKDEPAPEAKPGEAA